MSDTKRIPLSVALSAEIPREVLIALHETDGVGPLTIDKILLAGINKGKGIWRHAAQLQAGDWRDMGLSQRQASAVVHNLLPESTALRVKKHLDRGISFVTFMDPDYPELLRHIADFPLVLYYKGNWELVHNPTIAIVGTRIATSYGRKVAEDIAAGCAQRMTVVSGLARGIDTAAHLGALRKPFSTIAVLAASVDHCYPPENKALYREIERHGLLISETAPDTQLRPGLFPLRNRIIAGLSHGVIVVEAAERSGALITADLAFGYDRDVFLVPGPLTSPRSEGALKYLRKGGVMVLDETDIFQSYLHILPNIELHHSGVNGLSANPIQPIILSEDETLIYNILLEEPHSIDQLTIQSGMTFGLLHSVLLSLLIKYSRLIYKCHKPLLHKVL
jgi:DNA processing protein